MAAVLAFDFGMQRIGVAVGDLTIGIAHPVTTLNVSTNVARLAEVAKLVQEWRPESFVIGEPHHADDSEHEIAHLAKKFGNRLRENFKLPVAYVNETLSSTEASAQLAERGIHGRAQKSQLDAVAAQIILQSYLDAKHAEQTKNNLKARNAA